MIRQKMILVQVLLATFVAARVPKVTPEEISDLACYIVTDDVKVFDIRPL